MVSFTTIFIFWWVMTTISYVVVRKITFIAENTKNDTQDFKEYREYCRSYPNLSVLIMFALSFIFWPILIINIIKGIVRNGH